MQQQRIVDELGRLSEIAGNLLEDPQWQSDQVLHRVYDRLLAAVVWARDLPAPTGDVAPAAGGVLTDLMHGLNALIDAGGDEHLRATLRAQITGRLNVFLLSSGLAFGSSGIQFSR